MFFKRGCFASSHPTISRHNNGLSRLFRRVRVHCAVGLRRDCGSAVARSQSDQSETERDALQGGRHLSRRDPFASHGPSALWSEAFGWQLALLCHGRSRLSRPECVGPGAGADPHPAHVAFALRARFCFGLTFPSPHLPEHHQSFIEMPVARLYFADRFRDPVATTSGRHRRPEAHVDHPIR